MQHNLSGKLVRCSLSLFILLGTNIVLANEISACTCSGSGNCYEVTDDTSFDAVPWVSLGSGDTVRIYHRDQPYRKIIGLRSVATAEQPVKVCGVVGDNGELPVITGENATPVAGYLYEWGSGGTGENIGDFGVILVGRSSTAGDDWLHSAQHIIIESLKIKGAYSTNSYTPSGGSPRNFVRGAAGVRVTNGDYITIRNCEITENGNGIFLRGDHNSQDASITSHTLIEGNSIYHNGEAGSDRQHNIYSQGIKPLIQFNHIGKMRPATDSEQGALGTALKDRSAGAVIRYNWIESGARTLDLVSAEDADPVVDDPSYGKDFVYGNVLINTIDNDDAYVHAATITHFGADNLADDATGDCIRYNPGDRFSCRSGPFQRAGDSTLYYGTLHFFNNTVVINDHRSGDGYWLQDFLFEVSTSGGTVDARNNIFYLNSPNGKPHLTMMLRHGTLELNGSNWITQGWSNGHWRDWVGTIEQNISLVEGTQPGFAGAGSENYTLAEEAYAIDRGTTLAAEVISQGHTPDKMYQKHRLQKNRTVIGNAIDLGAFEFSVGGIGSPLLKSFLPGIIAGEQRDSMKKKIE